MRRHVSLFSIMSNDHVTYYLMTEDEILKEIKKTVREVSEILGLSSTTIVRLLLNYFHWDKDTLTDRYWEDPDKLFRILNLPNPNNPSPIDYSPLSPDPSSSQDITICKTCYSEKPPSEFYALECGHQHCLVCWQFYLESSIIHGDHGQKISCPSRCNRLLDDDQILKLLINNDRLTKLYKQSLVNAFVETNRLTHWCPGTPCSTVVKLKFLGIDCAQMINCDACKTVFCFQCLKQWHDPLQCSLLQKWEKKNRDESMTGEWIVANTKECPQCHSSIEKNGGCNHMTCRKPGCAHEFCWLCFGSWKEHGSRPCNVHEETATKNQLSAREILARYMHYFTRYQVHNQSLELESKLLEKVEQRIQEMQAESMSFTEQRAIYRAFDVLQECRRTLKYTYAFAFYLYRNNQAEVFEQNQADLEQATEALSGYLEQDFNPEDNTSIKLMDKLSYCNQRRKILLDHCKEGYTEHY